MFSKQLMDTFEITLEAENMTHKELANPHRNLTKSKSPLSAIIRSGICIQNTMILRGTEIRSHPTLWKSGSIQDQM